MQYWPMFYSFLIFFCYFTRQKAREISCEISETRKIFPYYTRDCAITTTYESHKNTTKPFCDSISFTEGIFHYVTCSEEFQKMTDSSKKSTTI